MSTKLKYDKRMRSSTDPEALLGSLGSLGDDSDAPPYRARLFHLFDLIEKEFDTIYAENCALRAKVASLSGGEVEPSSHLTPEISTTTDGQKASGRKASAMQMGQKLRTALRGPPSRLVFKVGGDGSRFRLTRQFEGHRDGVWHVAADSAKGLCATASSDQTSKVWSLETGACVATYGGHSGSVNCVAFAPPETNGSEVTIATASGDESAHIWKLPSSTATGNSEEECEEKENVEEENPADGVRLKTPLIRLTGHTGAVMACDWLAGGSHLLTASWDRSANIYDVEKGDVVSILSGHEQELNYCAAHPSQRLVVTSSRDSTFRLWDFRETIQSVAVFQGHQLSVTSIAFSSGDRVVSGSDDRTVKVWDLRNMRSAISTIRLSSAVNRISVSKNNGVIAIPLDNRHVRIYDLGGSRVSRVPNRRCHSRLVTCAAWVDDHPQHNLLTAGFDRLASGWKVALTRGE